MKTASSILKTVYKSLKVTHKSIDLLKKLNISSTGELEKNIPKFDLGIKTMRLSGDNHLQEIGDYDLESEDSFFLNQEELNLERRKKDMKNRNKFVYQTELTKGKLQNYRNFIDRLYA